MRSLIRAKLAHIPLSIAAIGVLVISFAPTAAADPTTHLRSEIDAARSESGCPPLRSDTRLNNVSQRVAHEIDDYVRHASTSFPTTGENDLLSTGTGGLMPVMREAGYNTNKAKLLLGYGDDRMGGAGDNEAKAIKVAVLQGLGSEAIPDCGYTRFGFSAINDNNPGGWPSTPPRAYSVTTVVLAGDA